MAYLDLIFNLALLVALTIVSGFIDRRWPRDTGKGVFLQGLLFGGAAVVGMLRPLDLGSGVIFDGRSVMVSLCALFFGPWTALTAGAMVVICRVILGGAGTLTGVVVTISSAAIGLAARYRFKPFLEPFSVLHLYLFGVAVHLAMIALMFTLPAGLKFLALKQIGLPVILLYPLATVLAGKILSDQVVALQRVESLKKSEEKYRAVFENAGVGIDLVDRQGRFLEVNTALARMLGYTQRELQDFKIGDVTHPDDLDISTRYFNKLISGASFSYRFEKRYLRKDGTTMWSDLSVSPIRDNAGNHWATIGVIRDISLQKQSEEEQDRLQRQLNQAQKMESVGRLAGGVAHDFNNMLGVIMGHAEMALEALGPGDSVSEDLQEIRKAAERSADLVRHLLAFARRQTIAPRVMDLNETIERMLKMLRRLMGENIDLVWKPGSNLWPVKMDPAQVDQIMVNLCVNARDAIAAEGGITIETERATLNDDYSMLHPEVSAGDYVILTVADNGCGMAGEVLDKIFDPFFTTKEVGKGTGLGLPTVYGIVRQNDGFVDVESKPGSGTVFRIYIPRYKGENRAEPIRNPREAIRGGNETVLLVEDDASILSLAGKMLERFGYRVLTAESPADALNIAGKHEDGIDLLVTDVVMPGSNGRDLSEKLLSLYPRLKTIFMSGYTADIIANHGVLEDGVDFVNKPFSMEELAGKVRETLDRKVGPSPD